ncbi:MAG: cell division protein FtsW [Parcubacteria group bacterium]|nr:cell division protein FtsW [Parcubacteria group bacterium]
MGIKNVKLKSIDFKFVVIVGILLVFGLFILSSASFIAGQKKFNDQNYYLREQLLKGVLIGIAGFFVFLKVPLGFLKKYSFLFLIFSIGILTLVFIPQLGLSHAGSTRWLAIGPVSFQPSEILKISFLIYLASWFESRQKELKDFSGGFLPFLMIIGIIGLLLLMQPNFGTFAVIALSAAAVYFVAGGKISHLALIAFIGVATFFIFIFLKPYGAERFKAFLNGGMDTAGSGYQINQAVSSIGVGGLTGIGLNQNLHSAYLPEPIGDSIFAVLGEKMGLFGISFALALYILFAIFGYSIAIRSQNSFNKLLAVGITSWILIQSFTNIAAISGLVPLTGMPLPFVSYGSSGLVINMIGAGIVANISRYTT